MKSTHGNVTLKHCVAKLYIAHNVVHSLRGSTWGGGGGNDGKYYDR